VINNWQASDGLNKSSDDELIVYFKVENGLANKLVTVSNSCKVNANNKPIVWLDNITAKESLKFLLESFAQLSSNQQGKAIEAIAYHQEESATAALIKLYKLGNTEQQQHLSLMLSMLRGEKGLAFVINQYDKAEANSLREEFIFSISQSPLKEAQQKVYSIAQTDKSTDIREQAIFWLSQNDESDSKETAKLIMSLMADEKNVDVRLHSVFALSQIKNGDGLEYLEKLITTSKDKDVRQQALFWLAESDEERAMPILESILGG
jgi:HEAT repeat protein